MALTLPRSLSPSKVGTFKDCALAFRYSAIDRLPEPSSQPAVTGSLVHRALELLFWEHPRGSRSTAAAMAELERAWVEFQADEELVGLDLSPSQLERMRADAAKLVGNVLVLEDPDEVEVVGTELTLEASVGGLRLRGIIDRLDIRPDGELVVVDYKTGRIPAVGREHSRLAGVQFYAVLCEEVLGRRPAQVRLSYLREPIAIDSVPTDQTMRGLRQRTAAVWAAIERACEREDFRPRPSALCSWCSFQSLCPAFSDQGSPASAGLQPVKPG